MNEERLQYELYVKQYKDTVRNIAEVILEDLKLYTCTDGQLNKEVSRYKKMLSFSGMSSVANELEELYRAELESVSQVKPEFDTNKSNAEEDEEDEE